MFNKILPKTICHFFTTLFVSKIVPNYIFCRQHLPKIFFWVFLKSDLLLLLQIFAEKTRKKIFCSFEASKNRFSRNEEWKRNNRRIKKVLQQSECVFPFLSRASKNSRMHFKASFSGYRLSMPNIFIRLLFEKDKIKSYP